MRLAVSGVPMTPPPTMTPELRLGRWQDALADVGEVDAVITDPPYSARCHEGYRSVTDFGEVPIASASDIRKRLPGGSRSKRMPRTRFELPYAPLTEDVVTEAIEKLAPRQWWVVFGDHESARWWADGLSDAGLLVFAPVPWVRRGGAPRFMADGPSCSAEWITVARPRKLPRVRSVRPGYYLGSVHCPDKVVTGGKPTWLMRAIVRDYSEPGDMIVDPFAGGATTLLAAAMEGRRSIGSEMDPDTFAKAKRRLANGWTQDLFGAAL